MKYSLLILLLGFTSCFTYRAYEPVNADDFKTFREQLEIHKKYKISTLETTLKIEPIKWEGDSLVAYRNGNKSDTIILAENQITGVEHEVFSRGKSDMLTFGIYGILGGIIYLLLK